MVKIAVAGGSGEVGGVIVEALLKNGHEVAILSRKDSDSKVARKGLTWRKVFYGDKKQLVKALQGIHTVLSFIVVHLDSGNVAQMALIDACIEAGVKRFAPSEWVVSHMTNLAQFAGKIEIRRYLESINREEKVLEYCLFQPGIFLDYLAPKHKIKNLTPANLFVDFLHHRAITLQGADPTISLMRSHDVAKFVTMAVEYEGEWPVVGGISGDKITISELLALGAKIRGNLFAVESLKAADLETGRVESSWVPVLEHPSLNAEQRKAFADQALISALLTIYQGHWSMSDEWNRLLPNIKFTGIHEYLTEAWAGEP